MARSSFVDQLKASGIQTSLHYPPVHTFSYYRGRYVGVSLPCTEEVTSREVTLPLYSGMNQEQIDAVVRAVLSQL